MSISKKEALEFLEKLEKEHKEREKFILSFKKQFQIGDEDILTIEDHNPKSLSLANHILDYLSKVNTICSVKEIAEGLLQKGVTTTSNNFPEIIRKKLYDLKKENKVISIETGQWKVC